MEHRTPSAVQIVKKEGDELKFDKEALKGILGQPSIANLPLALVSIAGEARKGKSFIMNFLLRYLRHKGFEGNTWISNDTSISDGFIWKGGSGHVTDGILIWNEAFIVTTPEFGKVAVLFVDTQGLFTGTSKTCDTQIFSLSVLMSSAFIYNVHGEIDSRDLEFIEYFTSHARENVEGEGGQPPFQRLLFLVRDYYDKDKEDDEDTSPFGSDGGDKYLEKLQSSDGQIEKLRRGFKEVGCFLMPYPGEFVERESTELRGNLKDLDSNFVDQLSPLAEYLLHPKYLAPKRINGKIVTSAHLLKYTELAFKQLYNVEAKTLAEISFDAEFLTITDNFGQSYTACMEKNMNEALWSEDELKKLHEEAKQVGLDQVTDAKLRVTDDKLHELKEHLANMAEHLWEDFKDINSNNKVQVEYRIENLVNEITSSYQDNLHEECAEILDDKKLEALKDKLTMEALEKYKNDERNHRHFSQEYQMILEKEMEKSFQDEKKKMKERKLELELQDDEKKLKGVVTKCLKQFSKSFKDFSELYFAGHVIENRCTIETTKSLETFDHEMKEYDEEKKAKYRGELEAKLDDAANFARARNESHKNILQRRLAAFHVSAVIRCREAMSECLKEGYFDLGDLSALHDKLRNGLVEQIKRDDLPMSTETPYDSIYKDFKDAVAKTIDDMYPVFVSRNLLARFLFTTFLSMVNMKVALSRCEDVINQCPQKFRKDIDEACALTRLLGKAQQAMHEAIWKIDI